MLACSGQFHPSTSCTGRHTKFHPSTSSGSFGRQCACKQKLSVPVHSTLLDDFDGRYLVNFDSRINEKEKNISRQENGSTVDYVI